ncbi:MAG TPA: alpha/beta hydrolase [Acidimicrobiales bacterium]|nr:alpha/beta hydrolase [Acidimicrobiales bacterium]
MVLVHGSLCDHSRFDDLVAELRDGVTTFAMDRRGFGDSGDAGAYAIEREFEDVAAVVDAVAACSGRRVALWGHSYGANCAMGGAALTGDVGHLVLYEPSLGLVYPPGSVEAVEEALAAGDNEAAIRLVFVGILEMTEEQVGAMRRRPLWPVRVATAPTVPRECRAEEGWVYRPGQFDGVRAPTLVLTGSETAAAVKETTRRAVGALPDVRVRVLEGHGHMAHQTDPGMVASIIREFIAS